MTAQQKLDRIFAIITMHLEYGEPDSVERLMFESILDIVDYEKD